MAVKEMEWIQIGIDLAAIESRLLGHFMMPFDGGSFIAKVLTGDIHTDNVRACAEYIPEYYLAIEPKAARYAVKTQFYAMTYGGSDKKLGSIINLPPFEETGAKVRKAMYQGMEGLEDLINSIGMVDTGLIHKGKIVKKYVPELTLFDGRVIPIRAKHARLNTLLQANAALVFKLWCVTFWQLMTRRGYPWKDNYNPEYWALMINLHDEKQIKCRKYLADIVIQTSKDALAIVQEHFDIKCPLALDAKIGKNWSECH